jgi:hypothetical protein
LPKPDASGDFGEPVVFVSQKRRVLKKLKIAAVLITFAIAMLAILMWTGGLP